MVVGGSVCAHGPVAWMVASGGPANCLKAVPGEIVASLGWGWQTVWGGAWAPMSGSPHWRKCLPLIFLGWMGADSPSGLYYPPCVGIAAAAALPGGLGVDSSVCDACLPGAGGVCAHWLLGFFSNCSLAGLIS